MFDPIEAGSMLSRLHQGIGVPFLLRENEKPDSIRSIFYWWEGRRLQYNLILLVLGLISSYIYWHLFDLYAVDPSDDGIFPGLGMLLYGIAANVCYTAGSVFEIFLFYVRKKGVPSFGRSLFCMGLIFSILLTCVPAICGILNTQQMHAAHLNHWKD